MNSGEMSKEEMDILMNIYKGDKIDKVFSTGLLGNPANVAGPRSTMFGTHYSQHVVINNPESPRFFSGYERTFGKYLDSYYRAEQDYQIIHKIVRHSNCPKMSYILVVKAIGKDEYDIIRVSHYEKLSDMHGYMREFTPMDDKGVGSTIIKHDMIYKANTIDNFGNYRYGVNANTAYMFLPDNKEDAIIVSQSFANRTTFNLVTKTEVVINKNDIPINIFGDLNNYKCLMNVGEAIDDRGLLLVIRKMNKKNISADFTDSALSNIYYTDNKFKGRGVVVDISLKVNDVEELQTDLHRSQLLEIYNDQFRYNKEIYDVLLPIVTNPRNKYTSRLEQELLNATKYIDPDIKYSCNSGNFEFAHLTIYTSYETPLIGAMKLTNRCGGKSVIKDVIPDDQMPVDIHGTRADIVCVSNGVIGRQNLYQLYEQSINYISDEILRRMKAKKSVLEAVDLLIDYTKTVNEEWGNYIEKSFKHMSLKQKHDYLENLYNSKLGIFIYNPPMYNTISFEKLKKIANKYKIKVSKVKMRKEYTVSKEIMDMYDNQENIDFVKNLTEKFTFAHETNKKETKVNEFTILDAKNNVKNRAGLKLQDYKENEWVDKYIWNDNETSILDIKNEDLIPEDLADYLDTIQRLDEEIVNKGEISNKELMMEFNTTKSKVFKKDDHTLIREFTTINCIPISSVYFMVLRHIPDAGFSARSLGSMTPLGLPNKTMKKSEVGKPYNDTCNQMSDMDNCDLKRLCEPDIISRFFAVHSKHLDYREEMGKILMFDDPRRLHNIPVNTNEISDTIPIRMMNGLLSGIGLEILPESAKDPYEFLDGVNYKSITELMKKAGLIPKEEVKTPTNIQNNDEDDDFFE